LAHELVNLAFADSEAEQLQEVVELTHLYEVVVIIVDLLENFVKSQTTLVDDLEQVVKNLILGVMDVPVLLLVDSPLDVILIHELIEFYVLDDTVLVPVDLLEEGSNFFLLKAHVKVAGEVSLEALEGQVTNAAVKLFVVVNTGPRSGLRDFSLFGLVKLFESISSGHLRFDLPLDGSEDFQHLKLVIELADNSLPCFSNIVRR